MSQTRVVLSEKSTSTRGTRGLHEFTRSPDDAFLYSTCGIEPLRSFGSDLGLLGGPMQHCMRTSSARAPL
eukprot:5626459-Prymnesium_polylepis.1